MTLYTMKPEPDGVWRVWFAWYPVWVGNDLVWLEMIARRKWRQYHYDGYDDHVTYARKADEDSE